MANSMVGRIVREVTGVVRALMNNLVPRVVHAVARLLEGVPVHNQEMDDDEEHEEPLLVDKGIEFNNVIIL